jgi:hypothetical protein
MYNVTFNLTAITTSSTSKNFYRIKLSVINCAEMPVWVKRPGVIKNIVYAANSTREQFLDMRNMFVTSHEFCPVTNYTIVKVVDFSTG